MKPPTTLATLAAELRSERLAPFDASTLLWLAALPEWTDMLAEEARFEQAMDRSLLDRLEAFGYLEQREVLDDSGQLRWAFWLSMSGRAEVSQHLRLTSAYPELRERVAELATSLVEASTVAAADPGLRSWLRVVERHVDDPSGQRLLRDVTTELELGHSDIAQQLVGAAEILGVLLGEPLASSARRAQWRIDREYRQELDARTLTHFLPRPEVEEALLDLVADQTWAVHLLGSGGVGKTTTVRDLASGHFASRHGLPAFPVARVDFDHLDPNYPQNKPAELLLALIQELTGYTDSRQSYLSNRTVEDASEALHELTAEHADARRGTDASLLDLVLDQFADYLERLPGSCVVLALDTCEELAKLHPPGGRAPAIDHTFDILDRIRLRTGKVRVLLAGRRWLVPAPEPGRSTLVLDPRPYLTVVQVHGFSYAQAEDYLTMRDPGEVLSTPLRAALIARSSRAGSTAPSSGDPADNADDVNPFDLSTYCDWALTNPSLDADRLRISTGDPYVEQRVIGRLESTAVRDCLPVAVELGRFDQAMITPYLTRRGIDANAAFSGLIGQEWVSTVIFNAEGRPLVVEVDEHLRTRLRDALARQPGHFPIDRAKLGRDLSALVDETPLGDLQTEAVEGAVRLLDVTDAAALWTRLESRITNAGAWGWAAQAIPRVAAVESARTETVGGPTLLAAIMATNAVAVARQHGQAGLADLWRQVIRLAPRHPDPGQAELLNLRGQCGWLACGQFDRASATELTRLWRQFPAASRAEPSMAGPMMAAIEAGDPRFVLDQFADVLEELCHSADEEIRMSARLARAAGRRESGDLGGAAEDTRSAVTDAGDAPSRRWADWLPPARPRDRTRLAQLVLATDAGEHIEYPISRIWRSEALDRIGDIDAERLIAATLEHELSWGLIDEADLTEVETTETYRPDRQPTQYWQRAVPSLLVVLAQAVAAAGEPDRAARLLSQRQRSAISAGDDPATVAACELALLSLCRTFRSTSYTPSVRRLAEAGTMQQRAMAWSVLALVVGEHPADPQAAGAWQVWWRTLANRRYPEPLPQQRIIAGATIVDEAEVQLACTGSLSVERRADLSAIAAGGLDLVRLGELLRARVLVGMPLTDEWRAGAPPRLVAVIAMAEGELLALRLPEHAMGLLLFAARAFDDCDDRGGAYRARVLAVLTAYRAGIGGDVRLPQPPVVGEVSRGWQQRAELARMILSGEPTAVSTGSPETDIRHSKLRQRPIRSGPAQVGSEARVLDAVDLTSPWTVAAAVLIVIGAIVVALRTGTVFAPAGVILATGLGYWLEARRRLSSRQETIGFNLDGSRGWSRCSVVVKRFIVTVRPDEGPRRAGPSTADLPRLLATIDELKGRQAYRVVPIVIPTTESDIDVERQVGRAGPLLGGVIANPVRVRHTRDVISWSGLPPIRDANRVVYLGPRNLGVHEATTAQDIENAAVVHLVGTPVFTAAGWRIRVGDVETGSRSAYTKTGRGTYSREVLVGPGDIGTPSAMGLVILQAEPVDGPPSLLEGTSRRGMCELANEFADSSAQVIVLPPLPDMLAERVVHLVRVDLQRRLDAIVRPSRILDIVHRIRMMIASSGAEVSREPDGLSEWDVLLFVPSGYGEDRHGGAW